MTGEECTATVDAAFGKTPSSFTKGSSLSKVWRFTVLDKMSKSCIKWCHLHLKTCFFWIQSFVFFLTARKRVSQRHSCTKKHGKTLKLSVFWCFVACILLLQVVKKDFFQEDIYLPLFVSKGIEPLFLALSTASWCKCKTNLNCHGFSCSKKAKSGSSLRSLKVTSSKTLLFVAICEGKTMLILKMKFHEGWILNFLLFLFLQLMDMGVGINQNQFRFV